MTADDPPERVVVAVDGGGSKTDAVAVGLDGAVRAFARGGPSNAQGVGLARAVGTLSDVVGSVLDEAASSAGRRVEVARVGLFVAGLDFDREKDRMRRALAERAWSRGVPLRVENDMLALLRTGTDAPNAVAVVCGTGINCLGVRGDGATVRFPALGSLSGDWGGGGDVGMAALWSAARAADGRGEPTELVEAIPRAFGRPDLVAVIEALHFGDLAESRVAELSPLVFRCARRGDAVAGRIVDALGDEIALMSGVALDRLGLADRETPVVVGGGVASSGDDRLMRRIRSGLSGRAPLARLVVTRERPIIGAALQALADDGAPEAALRRARRELTEAAGAADASD